MKLLIACVYKPPKDKLEECIKSLTRLVTTYEDMNYEIWILGDFNADLLHRDDTNTSTVQLIRLVKNLACPN